MKKNLLFLVFVLQSFLLLAQTSFTASVNKNKIGLNEQFSVTFTVNDSGDRFTAPNLSDFTVLAGPSTSSSTTIINGTRMVSASSKFCIKRESMPHFQMNGSPGINIYKNNKANNI